jgi:hypothetical protein
MSLSVRPNFIDVQKPLDTPLRPTGPADQTAGAVAGGLDVFGKFLQDMHDSKLKSLQEKSALERAAQEAKLQPFKEAQAQAESRKAISDADMQSSQSDAMKQLTAMDAAPSPAPEVPTTEAIKAEPNVPAPAALKYSDEGYKFDAEKEAQSDPHFADTLKHMKLQTAAEGKPGNLYKMQKDLTDEVSQEKIKEEFARQLPNLSNDYNGAPSYQGARKLLMRIDPKGLIKSAEVNEMLKQFPDEMENKKFENTLEQQKQQLKHQNTMEANAIAANTRAADAAERQANQQEIANARADKTQTREQKQFVQQQQKGLGDDIQKGEWVKATSAYNGVMKDLGALKNKGAFKALQGLSASSDGDNSSVIAAVLNTAARIPVASWVLPGDVEGIALRKAKDALDKDPNVKKQISDPTFQRLSLNLFGLINADLKRSSGTAVTGPEMSRFMNQIGLSVWDGDAGKLEQAMAKYGSDMKNQLKLLGDSYPDADHKVIPKVNIPLTKADAEAIKWAKQHRDDPRALDILKLHEME